MRGSWARTGAVVLVVVAASALWLPWWTPARHTYRLEGTRLVDTGAEWWRGTAVVGTGAVLLAVVAALVAVGALVGVSRGAVSATAVWWVLGVAGVLIGTIGAAGVAGWGPSTGSVGTLLCGAAAVVAAVVALLPGRTGFARLVPVVVVLVAVPVWFWPGATARADGSAGPGHGPFERLLAPGDGAAPDRSGTPSFALTNGTWDLVPVGDTVGVAMPGGLVALDDDGRPVVLVRTAGDAPVVHGIVDDRLVTAHGRADEVRITPLDGRPPAVVSGVDTAGGLTSAGVLLLDSGNDVPLRRLDVRAVEPGAALTATDLDELPWPGAHVQDPRQHPETGVVAAADTVSGPGDVLVVRDDAGTTTAIVGNHDPGCATAAAGTATFVPRITGFTPAPGGGWWLGGGRNSMVELLRLDDDGGLRVVPVEPLGTNAELLPGPDGAMYVLASSGLYRLSDAESALRTPPRPDLACTGEDLAAAPAALTELPDGAEFPLDAVGRRAAVVDGAVQVTAADGTTTAYGPVAGPVEAVVPDGSGGVWWLEVIPGGTPVSDGVAPGSVSYESRRLVHASVSGEVRHYDRVRGGGTGRLHPDLSGGAPLVDECERFTTGAAEPPPAFPELTCQSAVVAADGTGWLVASDGLYRFDATTATKVLSAGRGGDAPVSAQLARGVAPAEVVLREPSLGMGTAGQALIGTGDVLLGVTADGAVTVLAQDERLRGMRLTAVEGGTIGNSSEGTVRLDY